jgi:hypothetical protein
MSILPKNLFLPIKTKQDADKLLDYLSKVKPKERYSYKDCIKDIKDEKLEKYFHSKALAMGLFPNEPFLLMSHKESYDLRNAQSEFERDVVLNTKSKHSHATKAKTKAKTIPDPHNTITKKTKIKSIPQPEQATKDVINEVKKIHRPTAKAKIISELHETITKPTTEDMKIKKKYKTKQVLNDITNRVKEREFKNIIARGVSAKQFVVTDGCIEYNGYKLRSVKVHAIPEKILEQIPFKFTLARSFFHNGEENEFIFSPPTDLSWLLSEAERLRPQPVNGIQEEFPQYGTFKLPWEFVKFNNGEMLLMHPNPSQKGTSQAYKFKHPSIVASFNCLMPYLQSSVKKLTVRSADGIIVRIDDIETFKEAIPQFLNRVQHLESDYNIIPSNCEIELPLAALRVGHSYTLAQLHGVIRKSKSPYLLFLSEKQMKMKKIYYVLEYSAHTDTESEEYGYLFTTQQSYNGITTVVFENSTDQSRSSLIFLVYTDLYQKGVDDIINFLNGDMINKRQKLARRSIKFNSKAIQSYYRVVHQSFDDWKLQMRQFYHS